MVTFALTVIAHYEDGSEVSRAYEVEAPDFDQARMLAAVRFGHDEVDSGRMAAAPVGVVISETE